MVKQVKIFHRYEDVSYPPKRGLLREIMLTDDEEHKPLIRAKRGRELLLRVSCHWCCNVDKEFYLHHSRRDLKSWKSRCKKQHQWEKHRHTKTEYENTRYYNAEKDTLELYRRLSTQQGGNVLDVRTDHHLDDALDLLEKEKVVSVRNCCPEQWRDPIRWVKLTGKRLYQAHETDPFDDSSPESDRHGYEKRRRHTGKLPRRVRRHWQYRQWDAVITSDSTSRTARYVELLDIALKSRFSENRSTSFRSDTPIPSRRPRHVLLSSATPVGD